MVEDNPVNCLVAEGFLAHVGHRVIVAQTGAEAKQRFIDEDFDLALLDINLPDCNGVELLDALRQLEIDHSQERIPMVAVSAHVFNEEVQEYLNAGFDGYLPKPLDKDALLNLVQSVLTGRTLVGCAEIMPVHQMNSVGSSDTLVDIQVLQEDSKVLGSAKVGQLVDLFAKSSEEILNLLEQAEHQEDSGQIKQLAHKLKGSAGSMGMSALYALCLSIESDPTPLARYQQEKTKLLNLLESSLTAVRAGLSELD